MLQKFDWLWQIYSNHFRPHHTILSQGQVPHYTTHIIKREKYLRATHKNPMWLFIVVPKETVYVMPLMSFTLLCKAIYADKILLHITTTNISLSETNTLSLKQCLGFESYGWKKCGWMKRPH